MGAMVAEKSPTISSDGAAEGPCSRSPEVPTEDLVAAAVAGSDWAWRRLVARFAPLVSSIARRYRLSPADAADVAQSVWLKLFAHITDLRDPRALPGWISIVSARECQEAVATQRRTNTIDVSDETFRPISNVWNSNGPAEIDEPMMIAECRRAIQEGLLELSPRQRTLLLLLMSDPPTDYLEISRRLDMPVGSIGPTRARCLAKLRNTNAVRRLVWELPSAEGRSERIAG